ncbi:MAG TPA: flagellar type III secretion system pore protein FliP [Gammaproteobacteria bacterium]|nr:flagellar type III secretion system pore protein FliP [Gammaproteobacteria bacterium]
MKRLTLVLLAVALASLSSVAEAALPAVTVTDVPGEGQTWSLTLQVLVLMTLLTLLPGIVLAMTSFTRIVIVFSILRQALGTANSPPNQVLIGLSLFLSWFIMAPVLEEAWQQGVSPYLEEEIPAEVAIERAAQPLRGFMLRQTRENDVAMFLDLAGIDDVESTDAIPLRVLIPAFVTSELKTAFQIGFMLFIPFVIIDLLVASVLMSLGMMMVSPMLISLPFKLMLFVLADGWVLLVGTLVSSFGGAG